MNLLGIADLAFIFYSTAADEPLTRCKSVLELVTRKAKEG